MLVRGSARRPRQLNSLGRSLAQFEPLEARCLLVAELLPDLHPLPADLGDYEVYIQGSTTLLRFSTAMANGGEGAFEIRAAEPRIIVGDRELVKQRIYNDNGTFSDRDAGTFEYHPGHGHIHYSGFAQNRLLARGPNDEVGPVLATGDKTSFSLLDLRHYAPELENSPEDAFYGSGGLVQGISVGWADIYNRFLQGQNIDITGIPPGNYWLEVEADPDNAVRELDETNNIARIPIELRPQDLPFDGLDVIGSSPRGASGGPVDRVLLTFRKPVNPATFTTADVSFVAAGQTLAVDGVVAVSGSNNTQFEVRFASQSQVGTYTMNIGPDITAADGDLLDTNQNDVGGEAGDVYIAIFTIAAETMIAGPDASGYRALAPATLIDVDLEPGQPGVVTTVDNADDSFASINLGNNTFNFYGVGYTGSGQLFVSSNGLISFGSGNNAWENGNLASTPAQAAIAVLWDDWLTDVDANDRVLHRFDDLDGDGRSDRLIVEWNKVYHVSAGSTNPATFRAILELNTAGRSGEVLLNYPDLTLGTASYDDGRSATVGIKRSGAQGANLVLVGLNGNSPYVREGGAVRLVAPPATVSGRHVFYNNSFFDGNNPAATSADDAAIDTSKAALLPGQTAGYANYTAYSRGINGLMIDLAGRPLTTLTAADFAFRTGNNNDPATWTTLASVPSVTTRTGAGVGGADRVTLIWPDGAITNKWLQVTVLPTPRTGLAASDVFYFGNAIGEVGNTPANAIVSSADEALIRVSFTTGFGTVGVTSPHDIDKNHFVQSSDAALARVNQTTAFTALRLITVPVGTALLPDASLGASAALSSSALLDAELIDALAASRRRRRA
jgi:hypothetical protein